MKKKNVQDILVWVVVFTVILAVGLHVRFYPARANIWSDSNQQATVLVLAKLREMISVQVAAQMAGAPKAEINRAVEQRFAQTLHTDSAMVRKTIAEVARTLHTQSSDGKKQIYLQEADGYYYLDLTQTIEKTGHLAREYRGSKYLNEKMAAPFGFWQPINFHPFVGFYFERLVRFFHPQMPLVEALSYVGPFLSSLALAAFLLVCYALRLSPLAALIGGMYFYLAPIFVKRSTFAWYDDDSYNLLFPLLILAIVFYALDRIRDRRQAVIFGLVTSLICMTYALFWHGWGYTFGIVMVSGVAIIAAHQLLDRWFVPASSEKRLSFMSLLNGDLAVFFLTILGGTIAAVSVIFGINGVLTIFLDGFAELRKFTSSQLSLWPNLFVAVGELKRSTIPGIIDKTGNLVWFIGALLSVPWLAYITVNRRNRAATSQLIVLTVLLLVDIKITLGAERFILLVLAPLSVLFTMGLSNLIGILRNIVHPSGTVPARPSGLEFSVGIVMTAVLIFFPVRSIYAQIADLLSPIYNATWEAALVDIKEKTPADAIVTSWWPPGHFIKAIADRRVTFDGATLSKNKEAYWVANIFITSDERKAAGILRMLNTSGTTAVDFLESAGLKTSSAISLLHFILPMNRAEAAQALKSHLPAPAVEKLLNLTHGDPPPSYLLVYSELMEKNIGLEFVGKWNFKQIEDLNQNPEALKKMPKPDSPAFYDFLWSTMGGAYKYSEALIAVAQDGSKLLFDQGLTIDLNGTSAVMTSPKFGRGVPQSVVYFDGARTVEKEQTHPSLNYSVVLFKEGARYYCRLMDRELANSLLVKFFIFKGRGMDYFAPLSLHSDMTGRDEVDVFELRREKF